MKRINFRFVLTGLLGFVGGLSALQAQTAGDAAERHYKAAVRSVQTGDYERAKTDLAPLIQENGSLAPYAHYYYALALFKQKNYAQTRLILNQLTARFPSWRKLDDARYLLACADLENDQYEEGLTALQRISTPDLKPAVTKLERYFLGRLTDLNRLKGLQKEFSSDKNLAQVLVDVIQRTSTDTNDLALASRLSSQFGLSAPARQNPLTDSPVAPSVSESPVVVTPAPSAATRNRNKGYYNVAVLFPFRIDEFDVVRRSRANQYVYDLYEGIKLAKVKLQEEGITVNLLAYDIDNDTDKTLELLNNPAFLQTDLIVGPLYAEPNRLVTNFASLNTIALINPIATSSELIANQPQAFLAQPSLDQQAEKTADFAKSLAGLHRAAIYFGTSRKDSLLAVTYQTVLKRQGFQVPEMRKLKGSADEMALSMKISSLNKLSHVFLASSNEGDGARFLTALDKRQVAVPVIATAPAFDYYRNSMSTFTRRELYLLSADYSDNSRPAVEEFKETYLSRRNIIPSIFASQGYDLMLFFGRSLAKTGATFQKREELKSDTDDYVLSGFDYTQSNDNQLVPIIKYENGRFVKANE